MKVSRKDSYQEVGPGDNFLSTAPHAKTLCHSQLYGRYMPSLVRLKPGVKRGSLRADQRATVRWKEMLNEYTTPPIDENVV